MKNPKKQAQGSALITLLGGILILIAVLFLLVKLATTKYEGDVAETTEDATETRIMPVGRLVEGDGTEPGQRTGQQVFDKVCVQCHAADASTAFSPKITHNDQWAPRIAKGFDALLNSAINGFSGPEGGNMPAKGGATDLTDEEVARALVYMANKSGANFSEPQAGGAATAAASDSAASGATADAGAAGEAPKAEGKAEAKAEGKADAAPKADAAAGKAIFDKTCFACHGASSAIPNIPRITHKDEWAPRLKAGKDTVYKHAISGFNAMPARGGNPDLSDDEVKAAVEYMLKESGL